MKSIDDYNQTVLRKLTSKVKLLSNLQESVSCYLPHPLRPFCRVANYEAGCLKFAVASPAWATRLRYVIPELIQTLNQNGLPEIQSIQYYIEAEFEKLFPAVSLS